ncbi:hypothetical protein [Kistimonas asteriae]|uniref:hypothetical protein n=1 Tax=Kistimonas asteriae TaxID=517724 RepID=UPI001BA8322C|nr:hypothetical protein [Kistimonas asteriae]
MNVLHQTVSGVLLCGLAANVLAAEGTATDGQLGPTSRGTVPVELSMPTVVQISGLASVSFTYDPNTRGDLSKSQNFCIYTNNENAQYDINVASGNPSAANKFQLEGNGKTIIYDVLYAAVKNATDNLTTLTSGTDVAGTGANTTQMDCGGASGDVATLKLVIPEANLWAVPRGTYNDVLTLTVTAK